MYASSSTAASPAPSNQQHHHHHQNNKNEQHAFGADSDDEEKSIDSDEDDELGFQVYKDQASNTRYVNVASTNPTPPPNLGIVGRGISQQRLPPAPYQYPPEEQQPQHHQPVAYKPKKSDLVHMPQLGQEWDKNESKNDKDWDGKDKLIDKAKWNNRKSVLLNKKSHLDNSFKSFWKGDSNLFGWFNRIIAIILILFLLLLATLLVYFLVPRTPTIAYNNEKTFEGNSVEGLSFQVIDPIKFDFNGKINLAMTATTSYVKPKTTGITVILKDLSSAGAPTEIARGVNNTPVIVDTKEYTPFTVDLKFHYSANSIKDPIWSSWHEACRHKWPGTGDRPTIQIGIIVQWSLSGRLGSTFEERTIINNFNCPVELPTNAA
ncbi:hypothetical protein Pst134EA_000482 [Puccinia striiformis f. sp. tritici]|uniref:hypothetical protein n=1 Tax=Puccinia striiformis f. sp. tritici TaxID=168172 RepID=UPI002008D08E|nr:hypothetical protein Pst134EA_000482 [Puccinia striiformis f. sp. tritici]KAH9473409.1 hypothetical protein Pst134EA_000482 [Puccinia striiformis f. sp. tritici]